MCGGKRQGRWRWQGEFSDCSVGLLPAEGKEKKEGWVELVTDTVLIEIWPDQWSVPKPELSIGYVPTAVDWRGKVSRLPQRGFPGSKVGKEIHLGVKKSEPHVRSFIE